jgi:hypothetical protein
MYRMSCKSISEGDWFWGHQYGLNSIDLGAIAPPLWIEWRRWR